MNVDGHLECVLIEGVKMWVSLTAMVTVRGSGRSSHIAGSSVRNQRIERLWRDTFQSVCHQYYSLFYEMENSGLLDPCNETLILPPSHLLAKNK